MAKPSARPGRRLQPTTRNELVAPNVPDNDELSFGMSHLSSNQVLAGKPGPA